MIEKLNNETIGEQACRPTELTEKELSHVSGGYGDGIDDWCGTKVPGWHPPGPPVLGGSLIFLARI
jgi:bacteriocin-like protein